MFVSKDLFLDDAGGGQDRRLEMETREVLDDPLQHVEERGPPTTEREEFSAYPAGRMKGQFPSTGAGGGTSLSIPTTASSVGPRPGSGIPDFRSLSSTNRSKMLTTGSGLRLHEEVDDALRLMMRRMNDNEEEQDAMVVFRDAPDQTSVFGGAGKDYLAREAEELLLGISTTTRTTGNTNNDPEKNGGPAAGPVNLEGSGSTTQSEKRGTATKRGGKRPSSRATAGGIIAGSVRKAHERASYVLHQVSPTNLPRNDQETPVRPFNGEKDKNSERDHISDGEDTSDSGRRAEAASSSSEDEERNAAIAIRPESPVEVVIGEVNVPPPITTSSTPSNLHHDHRQDQEGHEQEHEQESLMGHQKNSTTIRRPRGTRSSSSGAIKGKDARVVPWVFRTGRLQPPSRSHYWHQTATVAPAVEDLQLGPRSQESNDREAARNLYYKDREAKQRLELVHKNLTIDLDDFGAKNIKAKAPMADVTAHLFSSVRNVGPPSVPTLVSGAGRGRGRGRDEVAASVTARMRRSYNGDEVLVEGRGQQERGQRKADDILFGDHLSGEEDELLEDKHPLSLEDENVNDPVVPFEELLMRQNPFNSIQDAGFRSSDGPQEQNQIPRRPLDGEETLNRQQKMLQQRQLMQQKMAANQNFANSQGLIRANQDGFRGPEGGPLPATRGWEGPNAADSGQQSRRRGSDLFEEEPTPGPSAAATTAAPTASKPASSTSPSRANSNSPHNQHLNAGDSHFTGDRAGSFSLAPDDVVSDNGDSDNEEIAATTNYNANEMLGEAVIPVVASQAIGGSGAGVVGGVGDAASPKMLEHQLQSRGLSSVFDPTGSTTTQPSFGSPGEHGFGESNRQLQEAYPAHPSYLPLGTRRFDGNMGGLTLPQFLMKPVAKNVVMECYITRSGGLAGKFYPKYRMYTETGFFLMSSQKRKKNKTSNYCISMGENDLNPQGVNALGKLRSNFMGSEFVTYSNGLNPAKGGTRPPSEYREELCAVTYSSTLWGKKPRGPRKMSVIIPRLRPDDTPIQCRPLNASEGLLNAAKVAESVFNGGPMTSGLHGGGAPGASMGMMSPHVDINSPGTYGGGGIGAAGGFGQTGGSSSSGLASRTAVGGSPSPDRHQMNYKSPDQLSNLPIEIFQNKSPKWNEQLGAFVLNFNKRVTQASVKNFQLISPNDPDTVVLQFGRVAKDQFNLDFRYPLSPYQAFAIVLSSFDYKLCCE